MAANYLPIHFCPRFKSADQSCLLGLPCWISESTFTNPGEACQTKKSRLVWGACPSITKGKALRLLRLRVSRPSPMHPIQKFRFGRLNPSPSPNRRFRAFSQKCFLGLGFLYRHIQTSNLDLQSLKPHLLIYQHLYLCFAQI